MGRDSYCAWAVFNCSEERWVNMPGGGGVRRKEKSKISTNACW